MNQVDDGLLPISPNGRLPLAEVARRLDGADILWAVFAGAAATIYGATRSTTDVDILLAAGEGHHVAALFPEARVLSLEAGSQRIVLAGYDLVAGLDLMDLDRPMATRLMRRPLGGVVVPVIPVEDNILLKAMWGRGQAQGKHDWEDVAAMMAGGNRLDWEYLRWRASTFQPTPHRDQVLARLEAMWTGQVR